jgi:hypothetical protein
MQAHADGGGGGRSEGVRGAPPTHTLPLPIARRPQQFSFSLLVPSLATRAEPPPIPPKLTLPGRAPNHPSK